MAACCAAPRTERRSRVGCRSGAYGVPAYAGVRAALKAWPLPSGIGALRQLRGVTRGRRTSAQEACPGTTSKLVLCAFTFPGARSSVTVTASGCTF
eukprot:1566960-Prymnesium_polylepis.1